MRYRHRHRRIDASRTRGRQRQTLVQLPEKCVVPFEYHREPSDDLVASDWPGYKRNVTPSTDTLDPRRNTPPRIGLGLLYGAIVLAAIASGCASDDPAIRFPKANIVMVSLDTLRADHLGLYGYHRATSPQLDALSDLGIIFELAVAQSSHTQPSHLSLFQSRHATATTEDAPHLSEILQSHGYHTAAFTGGGHISAKFGFDKGFALYDEEPEGLHASWPRIETWLSSVPDPPFFLFVHTYDIHLPYDPRPPYDEMFFPEYQGPVAGYKTNDLLLGLTGRKPPRNEYSEVEWNSADKRRLVALYDGGIREVDGYIGRLVDTLEHAGLWESTILVVFSDHGEEFWDHGSVMHGHTLFQELIRVPLLIRLPGNALAGTRIEQTVTLMDLAPTLLELVQIPSVEAFAGRTLLPEMVDTREPTMHSYAISETGGLKTLIRFPWKLVDNRRSKQISLFNLLEDPAESENRLGDQEQLAREMVRQLRLLVQQGRNLEPNVDEEDIDDEELRDQMRALGYLN